MSWREVQTAFADAVRNPAAQVPDAVGPRADGVPTARFNVYRNNSAVSLTEAIGESYPVVCQLVGDAFFTAMARAYVAEHAPTSPILIHYGVTFPDFIAEFEPAQSLPFLADVARVEWAWIEAYHAADQASISADKLQTIAPERLDEACLVLHPSVRLVRSDFPAASVWSAHQIDDEAGRQARLGGLEQRAEQALIVRPEFEVNVQLIDEAVWQLLTAFEGGATLSEAAGTLDEASAEHFGGMLGFVFSTGAISEIRID